MSVTYSDVGDTVGMKIKVRGGTAKADENLCTTCKSYESVEFDDGTLLRKCCNFDQIIKRRVLTCSEYMNSNHQNMYDMKEMAWVITPGKIHLGFRRLKTLSEEERDHHDIDYD